MKYSLRSLMRFSLRDSFWVTVVVALAVGWWVDRKQAAHKMRELADQSKSQYNRIYELTMYVKQAHPSPEDMLPPWGDPLPNPRAPAPVPPKK